MVEHTENKQPVKRVKGLPEQKQCLKFSGFECNCVMSGTEYRKMRLRNLRHKLGAYFVENFLDPGVAKSYDQERKTLCEGVPPKLSDRIKKLLDIRII